MSTKTGQNRVVRKVYRYSEAFKLQVVHAIEQGELSISEAKVKYGIKGSQTIQYWIKRMGKNHLLNRMVRIETPEQMDQSKLLKKRIAELERALAQTQLECLQSESYLRLACEQLGVELEKFKKKEISKPPTSLST